MNKNTLWIGLALVGLLGAASAWAEVVLDTGLYSGKVTAIVCGGCVSQIEQTMGAQPGIESPLVDSKTSTLRFAVKQGASVNLSQLQAALKASSDKMGMGADYRLLEVQKTILAATPTGTATATLNASAGPAVGAPAQSGCGCGHH